MTFLKTKHPEEIKESLQRFLADGKAETKERLNILLTDNGGEYVNAVMSDYLLRLGIKHQRTVPYSPQQNGAAERRNLTIMNMARTILIDAALPSEYWTFAVRYAVYTQNRLPTRAIDLEHSAALHTRLSTLPFVPRLTPLLKLDFEEAKRSSESSHWMKAAQAEMQAHKENSTWTIVDPPTNCKQSKICRQRFYPKIWDQLSGHLLFGTDIHISSIPDKSCSFIQMENASQRLSDCIS